MLNLQLREAVDTLRSDLYVPWSKPQHSGTYRAGYFPADFHTKTGNDLQKVTTMVVPLLFFTALVHGTHKAR